MKMTVSQEVQKERLFLLFDVKLQYREGMQASTSSDGGVGQYVGSGTGTVEGPEIRGTVRWDLYEEQGEVLCRSNLSGIIETVDGAEVRFDTMGFMRPDPADAPDRWIASAGVQFETDDPRYDWLNKTLAVWEGEFDMGTYRHRYRVYRSTDG